MKLTLVLLSMCSLIAAYSKAVIVSNLKARYFI
jgi:hypothetical protein